MFIHCCGNIFELNTRNNRIIFKSHIEQTAQHNLRVLYEGSSDVYLKCYSCDFKKLVSSSLSNHQKKNAQQKQENFNNDLIYLINHHVNISIPKHNHKALILYHIIDHYDHQPQNEVVVDHEMFIVDELIDLLFEFATSTPKNNHFMNSRYMSNINTSLEKLFVVNDNDSSSQKKPPQQQPLFTFGADENQKNKYSFECVVGSKQKNEAVQKLIIKQFLFGGDTHCEFCHSSINHESSHSPNNLEMIRDYLSYLVDNNSVSKKREESRHKKFYNFLESAKEFQNLQTSFSDQSSLTNNELFPPPRMNPLFGNNPDRYQHQQFSLFSQQNQQQQEEEGEITDQERDQKQLSKLFQEYCTMKQQQSGELFSLDENKNITHLPPPDVFGSSAEENRIQNLYEERQMQDKLLMIRKIRELRDDQYDEGEEFEKTCSQDDDNKKQQQEEEDKKKREQEEIEIEKEMDSILNDDDVIDNDDPQ